MEMKEIKEKLAEFALRSGAIRLAPSNPFLWASGYHMPIYNDNRTLLAFPEARKLICEGFCSLIKQNSIKADNIAGTATAGIPHATTLADSLGKSLSYVRSGEKNHGLGHQIEGLGKKDSYEGKTVLLIEDLVSTGKSSLAAVDAIIQANGKVPFCLAIFTYALPKVTQAFTDRKPPCQLFTLLDYDYMIERAEKTGYVNAEEAKILSSWRLDPFGWGEKHGFPKEG